MARANLFRKCTQPAPDDSPWSLQSQRRAASTSASASSHCSPVQQTPRKTPRRKTHNCDGDSSGIQWDPVGCKRTVSSLSASTRKSLSVFCSPVQQRRQRDWQESEFSDHEVIIRVPVAINSRLRCLPEVVCTSKEDIENEWSRASTKAPSSSSETSSVTSSRRESIFRTLPGTGLSSMIAQALTLPKQTKQDYYATNGGLRCDLQCEDVASEAEDDVDEGDLRLTECDDKAASHLALYRSVAPAPLILPELPDKARSWDVAPPPLSPERLRITPMGWTPTATRARAAFDEFERNNIKLESSQPGSSARILATFGKSTDALKRKIKRLDGMRKML